jgi:hypothetical protein
MRRNSHAAYEMFLRHENQYSMIAALKKHGKKSKT